MSTAPVIEYGHETFSERVGFTARHHARFALATVGYFIAITAVGWKKHGAGEIPVNAVQAALWGGAMYGIATFGASHRVIFQHGKLRVHRLLRAPVVTSLTSVARAEQTFGGGKDWNKLDARLTCGVRIHLNSGRSFFVGCHRGLELATTINRELGLPLPVEPLPPQSPIPLDAPPFTTSTPGTLPRHTAFGLAITALFCLFLVGVGTFKGEIFIPMLVLAIGLFAFLLYDLWVRHKPVEVVVTGDGITVRQGSTRCSRLLCEIARAEVAQIAKPSRWEAGTGPTVETWGTRTGPAIKLLRHDAPPVLIACDDPHALQAAIESRLPA